MAAAQAQERRRAEQLLAAEPGLQLLERAHRVGGSRPGDDDPHEVAERRVAELRAAARARRRGSRRRRGARRSAIARASGWKVWTITRPGASRPLRPASCVRSWNVRSSARKSGRPSPVSASTTAASSTPGKWWPFATICVPTSTARSARAKRSSASRSCSGFVDRVGVEADRSSSGRCFASSRSSFCVPAPIRASSAEPQAGHVSAHRFACAAVVAAERRVAVERQRDVAVRAAPCRAARTTVHGGRDPAPVQQQDRLAAALRDPAELGEQRRRQRIAGLAAQVDDAHRRQRCREPAAELEPLEPLPDSGRGVAEPKTATAPSSDGALRRDGARVVARIGLLLVRRVVLLVDADRRRATAPARRPRSARRRRPAPRRTRCARARRAARRRSAPSAGRRRGRRSARGSGRASAASARSPARARSRRGRAERRVARADVDLRLAAPGRAVEQDVAAVAVEQRVDPRSARSCVSDRCSGGAPAGARRSRRRAAARRGASARAARRARARAPESSRSSRRSRARGRRAPAAAVSATRSTAAASIPSGGATPISVTTPRRRALPNRTSTTSPFSASSGTSYVNGRATARAVTSG